MKLYFKVLAIYCVIIVINYICDPGAQKQYYVAQVYV